MLSLTFRPLAAFIDGALVRERLLAMLSGFFGASRCCSRASASTG